MAQISHTSGVSKTSVRRACGFTLVEVLVVIAILSVLGGLITVSVRAVRKSADLKIAKSEIQLLEQSALSYKNAFGDYPPTSVSHSISGLKGNRANAGIESLILHVMARKKGGPFHEEFADKRLENFDSDRLTAKAQKKLKTELNLAWNTPNLLEYCDLWGNPFVYIHHRDYSLKNKQIVQTIDGVSSAVASKSKKTGTFYKPSTFQIWSFGPDGVNDNGKGDDITSWE